MKHQKKTLSNFYTTKKDKKHIVDGIVMDSDLEVDTYRYLKSIGIIPEYASESFECVPSHSVTVKYYRNSNEKSKSKLSKAQIQDITYKPDFIFEYRGYKIIIECKGYETLEFKMRFKLFRRSLEKLSDKDRYIVLKMYTIEQLKLFIQQINQLPIRM